MWSPGAPRRPARFYARHVRAAYESSDDVLDFRPEASEFRACDSGPDDDYDAPANISIFDMLLCNPWWGKRDQPWLLSDTVDTVNAYCDPQARVAKDEARARVLSGSPVPTPAGDCSGVYEIAVRRHCPCYGRAPQIQNSCSMCLGERWVTIKMDGLFNEAQGVLEVPSGRVKEAFKHLAAYEVMLEHGFVLARGPE